MFIFISSFMGNFLHLAFYMVIISVLIFSVEFIICRSKLQSISFGVAIRAQKVGSLLRVSLEFPLIQSKISQKAIGYCRVSMLMWVINFLKQSQLATYAWPLWKARCQLSFNRVNPNFHYIAKRAINNAMEYAKHPENLKREYHITCAITLLIF